MTNRFCDTEIWEKDWFLELNTKQKLLVKFIFDRCDCAGFYKISWHLIRFYFNDVEITKEDFKKIKQLKFIDEDLIFIEDFALFQCKVKSFNDLNPKNNAHKGVLKLLKKYNIYLGADEGLTSPLNGAQDKDKEKEKDKEQEKETISFKELKEEKEKNKKEKEESLDLSDWYGFYKNVHLTSNQYGRLLSEIANKQALDGIIEELSSNIAQKKEKSPPYDENFPDMHFATLKAYWRFRKLNGFSRPPTNTDKAKALKDELDKLAQEYRIKDLNSG